MSGVENTEKMLSNDPCLGCDSIGKRNLFLEQIHPKSTVSKEPSAPSLFRQTLEQYQQSHLKYKNFSEAAFEGVIFHKKGIFIESNQQFADMFGCELDEISG